MSSHFMVAKVNAQRPRARGGGKSVAARFYANGIDLKRVWRAVSGLSRFCADCRRYCRLDQGRGSFPFKWSGLYPCLGDFGEPSGTARGHYFHQDLLVARKVFARRPGRHLDIGSRVDGFVAHLLSFMSVECVDIRPLRSNVTGLTFIQSDATELREFSSDSRESVSSLHAAEHFGLGRYGDPLDPAACFRFMRALERILAPGGRLYFSVPVGRERVEFNAHRVFAPATVLAAFADLELVAFSAVLDDGELYPDVDLGTAADAEFACGIFEFTKR